MTKKEYILNSLSSALQETKIVCDKLICVPKLKEKAESLLEEIRKEYEQTYNETVIMKSLDDFDFTKINASDRISAWTSAKEMLIDRGIPLANKFEQSAARALGASLEYLSKKKSLTADNLKELWKAPKQFFAEIKDDSEMSYGLTGIYLLLDNGQEETFNEIIENIYKLMQI